MIRRLITATAVVFLFATIAPLAPADAQWVMVARKVAGRIHHTVEKSEEANKPGYSFASVILEVPADRLFAVAAEHARANRAVRIVVDDPVGRRLQIAEGDRVATLNVVFLDEHVSQLLIAGSEGPKEDATSSRVVAAVLRICVAMRKQCSVGN